jgi:hypothetical protein
MSNLNFKEVGSIIRVNTGEDISLSTPTLMLQPELGKTKEITDGVTIPNVAVVVNGEAFEANEYIEYTTKECDLDYIGRWRKKAKLDFSTTDIRQTDYQKFRVLA